MVPILPPPNLDITLTEISRVLSFILSPTEIQAYEELVSRQLAPNAPLRAAIKAAEELLPKDPAGPFRSLLLSYRDPLFRSLTINAALRTPTADQLTVTAWLLSRLAIIASAPNKHLSVSPTGSPLHPEEASLFLGTTRRVGDTNDTLVSTPLSRHVVVWCNGRAFSLDILDTLRSPHSEDAIRDALKEITAQAEGHFPMPLSVASLSWNLSRSEWFKAREGLETYKANQASFVFIDTALATIALEPHSIPPCPAQRIEAVRTGERSVNRYADQVVGLVVFKDGS